MRIEPEILAASPDAARLTLRWRLTLECTDRLGLVAAVANTCEAASANIVDSAQFSDPDSGRFFMRLEIDATLDNANQVARAFGMLADRLDIIYSLERADHRPRTLLMVSRQGHCLADLLFRQETGDLPIEIAVVASNHERWRRAVERHGLPFVYLPVGPAGHEQTVEPALRALMTEHCIDLVVLARYMQVLSPRFCADFDGMVINIHHSFLPSFKGAHPYRQAHEHGVKLIGATAHYVTAQLDCGPIIEQAVERVDHRCNVEELVRRGRDIEASVLARALTWIGQGRIFRNHKRTVVL